MAIFYETIPPNLHDWILAQKLLFVATSPLSANGHVNVSPKGGQYFGIVDERTFYYMELSGSGIETMSHLHELGNGRMTVMFCAFEGGPKIVRLWGKGTVLENQTPEFTHFVAKHAINTIPGTRSIILLNIHQVGSSCGFSVPFYNFTGYRTTLNDFFRKKADKFAAGNQNESMDRYWAYKNAWSVDGLPGMKRGAEKGRELKVEPIKKMVGKVGESVKHTTVGGGKRSELSMVLVALVSFVLGALMVLFGTEMLPILRLEDPRMSGLVNATGFSMESLPLPGRLRR